MAPEYLPGKLSCTSDDLRTSYQSRKLDHLQKQLRHLNIHRHDAISRIEIPPYIFNEEEKHTIVCNFRLWDNTPLQLALALDYAPKSLENHTPKPRRGITEEVIRREIASLRKPGNLYHYIWDFWDPDRWHVAPNAGADAKASQLLARYEELFRQGRNNFLGLRMAPGLDVWNVEDWPSRKVMEAEKARRYRIFEQSAGV
ncbi:MAG: hypothetical protein L6R38_001866 [Xanthoria sp. 2 TBL-2021]|nr:MAG: hypothetical protein L6R38_001866 [Xanthoria sp. 2 TBL-2021]